MRVALIFALVGVLAPISAAATPAEEKQVLSEARNHFEFRTFDKVIALLNPWVHPPRILDPARLAEAQELLGISLHVTGEVDQAKRELEAVLLFDPDRVLDPFNVPPPVIESFESLRTAMKDRLDRIRAERGTTEPQRELDLGSSLPHPIFAWAPLGLAHFFALDSPQWGSLWLGLQVLGLGANIGAYWLGKGLRNEDGMVPKADEALEARYDTFQDAGLIVFGAAWIASAVHGTFLLSAENDARKASAQGSATAVGFSPIQLSVGITGATLTLRF